LELIGDSDGENSQVDQSRGRPFVSYTRTEDGTSLVTEVKALRGMFPAGDMEELDVQCAGELSCDDDDDDDDEDDCDTDSDEEGEVEVEYPILSPSIDLDLTMSYLPDNVPPTPPLTASSTTSSPGKKRLSLPLSPRSEIEIPFSWSRRTTRSMSVRQSQSMAIDGDGDAQKVKRHRERRSNGTKRCLQLDLRGVSNSAEGAYHLGTSVLPLTFCLLGLLYCSPIYFLHDQPSCCACYRGFTNKQINSDS
jgi:hypothetical protein